MKLWSKCPRCGGWGKVFGAGLTAKMTCPLCLGQCGVYHENGIFEAGLPPLGIRLANSLLEKEGAERIRRNREFLESMEEFYKKRR